MGRQSRGRAGRQLRLAASEKRVGCLSIRPDHGAVKRRLRREARPLAGNHHVLQLRSFACQCFSTTSPGLTWGRRQYPLLDKPCPKREARPDEPERAASPIGPTSSAPARPAGPTCWPSFPTATRTSPAPPMPPATASGSCEAGARVAARAEKALSWLKRP